MRQRDRFLVTALAALALGLAAAQVPSQGVAQSVSPQSALDALAANLAAVERGEMFVFYRYLNGKAVRVFVPRQQFIDDLNASITAGELTLAEARATLDAAALQAAQAAPYVRADYERLRRLAGGAAPAQASLVYGQFDSDFGVLSISPGGGRYSQPVGRLIIQSAGPDTMSGYWAQNEGAQACPGGRHGRYYGRFQFTFTAQGFTGLWGYCEAAPTQPWNGRKRAN